MHTRCRSVDTCEKLLLLYGMDLGGGSEHCLYVSQYHNKSMGDVRFLSDRTMDAHHIIGVVVAAMVLVLDGP